MDKLARFNGVCNFLAVHWKAGTWDRFNDSSFIPEYKIASRRFRAEIKNELENAEGALSVVWHDRDDGSMTKFVQALKRWVQANLNIIEFVELHAENSP